MTFSATVQPYSFVNERELQRLTPPQVQGRKRLFEVLHRAVTQSIKDLTGKNDIGAYRGDNCQAHFVLQVDNLLENIKDFAADLEQNELELVLKDEQQTRFNQLIRMVEPAVFVPQYFFFPQWVDVRGLRKPLYVGSTPRLLDELAIINRVLGLYIPEKMPYFLEATEEDLEDYPFGRGSELWINLGFVFMQRLAEAADRHRMPLFIGL